VSPTLSERGTFPPSRRVRHSREFNRIHREGVRVHTAAFTVIARATLAGPEARLGLAINRKVGSAPLRNRLRRLVRELFRRSALPAVDLVVVIKPEAARLARPGLAAVAAELGPALSTAASRALARKGARGGSGR
jgi:ribonuclease P protein component